MNEKKENKQGFLEIIAIVAGVLGCFLFDVILKAFSSNIHLAVETVWIALFAVSFGPIVGAIVGFTGIQFHAFLADEGIWIVYAVGMMFYGIILGRYSAKYGCKAGKFDGRSVLIFELVQSMASIVIYTLYFPLLNFVNYGGNIYSLIFDGIHKSLIICVLGGVIPIPVLFFNSKINTSRQK